MNSKKVWIQFIKPWGHPSRNEVFGYPQIVLASHWAATILVRTGYAKFYKGKEHE